VFPVPVRPAMGAATRERASRVTCRVDGRRVGAQTWAIWHRIRELDDALARDGSARKRLREAHPEVSFWAWNGRKPMQHNKKSRAGRCERLALATGWLGEASLRQARAGHTKADLADDDILDALACLWTAHRIHDGGAETLPASPPRDATGLPMEIVF
jgi:predicted RNase H-like nuclease